MENIKIVSINKSIKLRKFSNNDAKIKLMKHEIKMLSHNDDASLITEDEDELQRLVFEFFR